MDPIQAYERGRSNADWYEKSWKTLQELFAEDAELFAAILSITSINAGVQANVAHAIRAYEQYRLGREPEGFMPVAEQQLEQVFAGNLRAVSGPKIEPFYEALTGDGSAVVVDRWMYRIYESEDRDEVANKIRRDAERVDEEPARFQAAVWCGARNGDPRDFGTILKERLGLDQYHLPLWG